MRLDGVKEICQQPDAASWTCKIIGNGRLPDVPAIARAIREVGDVFWLRGVEVVAIGRVVSRGGMLHLELEQTRDRLQLAQPALKVQWSFGKQSAHPITEAERTALTRLKAALSKDSARVRIVGPLVGRTIEVREFSFLGDPDR